jgi:hypothetical protein
MKLFVTYGIGSNLANCYAVVEGKDYNECRAKVDEATQGKFAFTYTKERFEGQPEKYGLEEVPLQPQVLDDYA